MEETLTSRVSSHTGTLVRDSSRQGTFGDRAPTAPFEPASSRSLCFFFDLIHEYGLRREYPIRSLI